MFRVRPGGSGQDSDASLVAAELARLPSWIANEFEEEGIAIIACRGSVVDFAPRLRNDHPREWPPGKTWRDVPGAYLPQEQAVVVATIELDGRRVVPPFGQGHGSASLAVHEALHGLDYASPRRRSSAPEFRAAWRQDFARLEAEYYRHQTSGPEESYAESGARTFGSWAVFRDRWPALRNFWAAPTFGAGAAGLAEPMEPEQQESPHQPLGFGRVARNGAVQLFLTARGAGGEHGHGMIEVAPEDQAGLESLIGRGALPRDEYEFFDVPSLEGLEL